MYLRFPDSFVANRLSPLLDLTSTVLQEVVETLVGAAVSFGSSLLATKVF